MSVEWRGKASSKGRDARIEKSSCRMVTQFREAPSCTKRPKFSKRSGAAQATTYEHWLLVHYSRDVRVLAIIYSSDCHLAELERH